MFWIVLSIIGIIALFIVLGFNVTLEKDKWGDDKPAFRWKVNKGR